MLISKKTFERKKKNTAINQFGFAHQILNEINQQFIHKILDSHQLNNNY